VGSLEDVKQIIDRWQHQRKRTKSKRFKYIGLGLLIALGLLIISVSVFYLTDTISKPVASIGVTSGSGEWAMFGHDLTHSGTAMQQNSAIQGTITKVLTAGSYIHASPVIVNGVIYVGSRDTFMYAIKESTGQKLWTFKAGSWIDSSAAVVNNVVYFGSNDGNFYALNASNGSKLWSFFVKYPVRSSPAVANGRVYFGGDDYSIYCLDAVTGKLVWSRATDDVVVSSPAVVDGILYAGSIDGYFYAIDAKTGRLRLRFPTHRSIASSPAVSGSTVYFVTSQGSLFAVDGTAKNWFGESVFRTPWQILHVYGDLPAPPNPSGYLWSLDFPVMTTSSPTIAGDSLYVGLGPKVVCVNLPSQAKQWEYDATGNISYAFQLTKDTVFATSDDGHLYLLNASTGTLIKDVNLGGSITSAPVMDNGTVYVSSGDGNLYAIN
jgi:outer membrane protein assembly factor BamB